MSIGSQGKHNSDKTTYGFNVWLLIGTLVFAAVAGVAIYFWHAHSVSRIAQSFFDSAKLLIAQADQHETEGEIAESETCLDEAVELIWQYQRIRPENDEAAVLLATTFDRSPQSRANPRRAARFFVDAVARTSGQEQADMRLKVAEILLEYPEPDAAERANNIKRASEFADTLMEEPAFSDAEQPEFHARVCRVHAVSQYLQMTRKAEDVQPGEPGTALVAAIVANPHDFDLPGPLADVYRNPEYHKFLDESQRQELINRGLTHAEKADEIIDQMVERNPDSSRALLVRSDYRRKYDARDPAGDLERALELNPTDPEINLACGMHLLQLVRNSMTTDQLDSGQLDESQQQQLAQAQTNFETCIAEAPLQQAACLYLGEVKWLLGNKDEGLSCWFDVVNNPDISAFLKVEFRVRLIIGLMDLDRLDEARQELTAFDDSIKQFSRTAKDPRKLADLVEARESLEGILKRRQGSWVEAVAILEKAATDGRRSRQNQLAVIRELAGLYSDLEMPGKAASKYEMALRLDSTNREIRILLSAARSKARQFDEAVQVFEPVARESDSAADWLLLADLYRQRELAKPRLLQNWQSFDSAIQRTRERSKSKPLEQPWRLDFLEWNVLGARSRESTDPQDAIRLKERLQELTTKYDSDDEQDTKLILALATMHDRIGQLDEADRLLTKYESIAGNVAGRFINRAGILVNREKLAEASELLENGLATLDTDEHLPLRLAQMRLLLIEGKHDAAITLMAEIVEQNPDRPNLLNELARLAIQLPNQIRQQPASWESHLADIEGAGGPISSYFKAHRIVQQLSDTGDPDQQSTLLTQASRLCNDIVRSRPEWPDGHRLTGHVLELQSNLSRQQAQNRSESLERSNEQRDRAKRSYERAFQLGDRGQFVVLRLAELETDLVARQRLLAQLNPQGIAGNDRLTNMQAAILIAGNNLESARSVAEQATSARPNDPAAWITRARIELIYGDKETSELSVDQARKLTTEMENPQQTLLDIFRFYATADQYSSDEDLGQWKNHAYDLVDQVVEIAPANERLLTRAGMLEILGDQKAIDFYRQAVQAYPDNSRVLQLALQYIGTRNTYELPGAIDESIEIARKLVALEPQNAGHRRILATLLSRRGASDDWNQVAATLGTAELGAGDSYENERSLAALLYGRADVPNSERLENLQQAFDIVKDRNSATDLILAGRILRSRADLISGEADVELRDETIAEARNRFSRAGDATDAGQAHLYVVTTFFIDEELWDTAELYLSQLQSLKTNSILETAPTVALTARLMHRRNAGDLDTIIKMVEKYGTQVEEAVVNSPARTQAQAFQSVAAILESIDANQPALVWREKAVQRDPELRITLVREFARNKEFEKARIECAQAYQETGETIFVTMLADLLIVENAQPEHFEVANDLFETAMNASPEDLNLLVSIANARIVGQDRIEDAINLFEKALGLDPENMLILNNLATVYAEVPNRLPDALQTINRAINKFGNRPGLLDTKAVILMLQGQLDEAESILLDVVNKNSDSRYWWHLAEVKWHQYEITKKAEQLKLSKSWFDQSLKMGLESQILTPGEKTRLESLRTNLTGQNSGAEWHRKKNPATQLGLSEILMANPVTSHPFFEALP